ncbi:hypothetical protein D9615_003861 [Tricholomella constricta]|uniref:Uncharacterized protein n=1 Tax=Tricholomella constricta TaxID=117010 RepID=A0A8H5HD38_9AGAR|nr:hypothetical protein D9615_003861 [Tricholomella constricta]
MQYPSVFVKIRATALGCLSLAGVLWAILLCIVLFSQWEVLDISERTLVLLMLVTHTISAVVLLILLIVVFRPWLDAARIMLLLMAHIGIAGAFAYWYPNFKCVTQDPAQEAVCKLIIAYILIASWIVPFLFVVYGSGLALMVWRRRITSSKSLIPVDDEEKTLGRRNMKEKTPSKPKFAHRISNLEHFSNLSGSSRYSQSTKRSSLVEKSNSESVKIVAARLSKPLPTFHF